MSDETGKKYACEACIKGHRSSTCKHFDRPLVEVKKKGRPATQCNHCRELRKVKQVHVKCTCQSRTGEDVIPGCMCEATGECNCCIPRKSAPRVPKKTSESQSAQSSHSRPLLPQPTLQQSDPFPKIYAGPIAPQIPVASDLTTMNSYLVTPFLDSGAYPSSLSPTQHYPTDTLPSAAKQNPSTSGSFAEVMQLGEYPLDCKCGDNCRCPACPQHAHLSPPDKAGESCPTCLDCTLHDVAADPNIPPYALQPAYPSRPPPQPLNEVLRNGEYPSMCKCGDDYHAIIVELAAGTHGTRDRYHPLSYVRQYQEYTSLSPRPQTTAHIYAKTDLSCSPPTSSGFPDFVSHLRKGYTSVPPTTDSQPLLSISVPTSFYSISAMAVFFILLFLISFIFDILVGSTPALRPLQLNTTLHFVYGLTLPAITKRADCTGVCDPVDAIQNLPFEVNLHCTHAYTNGVYSCAMCRNPNGDLGTLQNVLDDLINFCRAGGRNMDRIIVGNPHLTSTPGDSGIPRTFTIGSVTSIPTSTSTPSSTSPTSPPSSATTFSATLPNASTSSVSTISSAESEGPPAPTPSPPSGASQPAIAGPPADPLTALLGAGPPSDENSGVTTNDEVSRMSRRWFGSTGSSPDGSGTSFVRSVPVYIGLWISLCNICL